MSSTTEPHAMQDSKVNVASGGDSPLHAAVRRGDHALAAKLIAEGADPSLTDAEGRCALDPNHIDIHLLHRIRQDYLRLPEAPYDKELDEDSTLAQLRRDGIVRVEGMVAPQVLRKLQTEFARCIRRMRLLRLRKRVLRKKWTSDYDKEEHWKEVQQIYNTNDALRRVPSLVPLSRDHQFVEMANRYSRKPTHLKRAYGMRYLPAPSMSASQFHWHHDMEDRQFKAMILLTDVPDEGQYMTYVRGSHHAFHSYERFKTNHLDLDYCGSYLDEIEILRATGKAGDVFLFDSNGMHSGNRSESALRDALFLEFTADHNAENLWGTALRRSAVPKGKAGMPDPLKRFLAATPKWKRTTRKARRKTSTWDHSLRDPAKWI